MVLILYPGLDTTEAFKRCMLKIMNTEGRHKVLIWSNKIINFSLFSPLTYWPCFVHDIPASGLSASFPNHSIFYIGPPSALLYSGHSVLPSALLFFQSGYFCPYPLSSSSHPSVSPYRC